VHHFHAWLRKPCKKYNGTMKEKVQAGRTVAWSRDFLNSLTLRETVSVNCSVRSPSTAGCALP